MKAKGILTILAAIALPQVSSAMTPSDNFNNGVIGTAFVSNGGSSTYEYKVLIDYRVHGRHRVELKFVERSNHEEPPLADTEEAETVMVNCTRRTYTTTAWLEENDNNYGYKQYQNGDAISWDDKSERAYANYGNGWMLPLYLKMVCDSL
jgi:hypothetical protein